MEELSILGTAALLFIVPPMIIALIYGTITAMKK